MPRWRWFQRPTEPIDLIGPATIYLRPKWVDQPTQELPVIVPAQRLRRGRR